MNELVFQFEQLQKYSVGYKVHKPLEVSAFIKKAFIKVCCFCFHNKRVYWYYFLMFNKHLWLNVPSFIISLSYFVVIVISKIIIVIMRQQIMT